uniref:Uncharacterized protein n=1 Tax=viral metagenome TaxID=1070528 RepID=A0A6C0ITQ3_9ZZZZ
MDTNIYKYVIEGGLNFYDELNASSDEEEINTNIKNTNINNTYTNNTNCLISGEPLDLTTCVTMQCGHKFNYEQVYKEIVNQKYVFKSYYYGQLTQEERNKLDSSHTFIKCPYCRSVQKELLPYNNKHSGYSKVMGVNTFDKNTYLPSLQINVISINRKNKIYKICKKCDFADTCKNVYVTDLEGTDKNYCYIHYNSMHKLLVKQKKEEEKKKKDDLKLTKQINTSLCVAVLKSGARKGQQCGSKCATSLTFCKRHS